jgi:uncharacterized membrane protein (DUF106 family)
MLDALSLIIGVLVGSTIDFVLTLWIEWKGTQWSKKEFIKLERKMSELERIEGARLEQKIEALDKKEFERLVHKLNSLENRLENLINGSMKRRRRAY